ncbi:MAG: penicillin-binding protein, partial [Sphingomonadales bacterium]
MATGKNRTVNFRIKREIGGLGGWYGRVHHRWWFRTLAILALLSGIFVFLIWLLIARNLPSVDTLRSYEPPLPTNVRSAEGLPIHS